MPLPIPNGIRQTLLQDRFLDFLLQQQAHEMTGCPGWPTTQSATYKLLLRQIENDLAPNGGQATTV